MIKKTLTYQDYDGVEHTKDFYFSMNQTEFALLNNRLPGGFESYLKRIQEDHDETRLLDLLTTFIVEAYGERLPEYEGLVKEDAQGRKLGLMFLRTEACDNLITDLLDTEKNNIGAFLTGMLPDKVRGKVNEGIQKAMAEVEANNGKILSIDTSASAEPAPSGKIE